MKPVMAGVMLAAVLMGAAPASAQFSPSGGPIDISADEVEIVDAQHLAIWRGNVEVLQARNRMRSDTLNVYFESSPTTKGSSGALAPGHAWGRVRRVEGEGHVFFVSPTQTARGDHGLYELASDTITITGDVIVAQGQSVVHGEKLVIQTKTGRATMVSEAGHKGRVRGIFYPNTTTSPSGAPTPPAPRQP